MPKTVTKNILFPRATKVNSNFALVTFPWHNKTAKERYKGVATKFSNNFLDSKKNKNKQKNKSMGIGRASCRERVCQYV